MRKEFADQLKEYMKADQDHKIWLLLGGVGYGFFKEGELCQIINCEASEQAMVDIAVGLALSGKIPIVYSITPHLYRAYEQIRNYVNHEKIPVKLVGVGRDEEYTTLGFSHYATDVKEVFYPFKNICQHLTGDNFDLTHIIFSSKPEFLTLSR